MAHEKPARPEPRKLPRRLFLRGAATTVTVTCLAPSLLSGCQAAPGAASSTSARDDVMEEALEMMSGLAPLTNHGPMAAEALVALDRADSVVRFVEAYKKRFTHTSPAARRTITRENWREALGDGARVTDWTIFFNRELKEAPWPQVLERWAATLAPGLAAAAAHGLLRTAHAVRSLTSRETELRRRELAEGLGYWAAYYQPLPGAPGAGVGGLRPAQALDKIPLMPGEKRVRGSIMDGLRSLNDFPPFAGVASLVGAAGGDAGQFISELTETFAAAYVRDVTQGNFIALIHSVTATTCLRSLLPYLSPPTTQSVLRHGWQTAAAIYSVYGVGSAGTPPEAKEIKRGDLVDRAVASREEHAIKFTEACLREYALNPKPVYLQAARDAVGRLGVF